MLDDEKQSRSAIRDRKENARTYWSGEARQRQRQAMVSKEEVVPERLACVQFKGYTTSKIKEKLFHKE
jgi:hypothetical protein